MRKDVHKTAAVPRQRLDSKDAILALLLKLEEKITRQINKIIHHPRFQRLEALWRSIQFLTQIHATLKSQAIKIKVLTLSARELEKDLQTAIEFDQSQLFKKIYSQEFDHPGGEPFGIILGDYDFSHKSINGNKTNSIYVLAEIAKVAAAAFTPFIANVDANFFGINNFSELLKPIDLYQLVEQPEYKTWKQLRQQDDSRFLALVMPKILIREPYCAPKQLIKSPWFIEETHNTQHYLWGSATFVLAEVIMCAFANTGWFANIRGTNSDDATDGSSYGIVRSQFSSCLREGITKSITETIITDRKEKILSDLGFIVLSEKPLSAKAVFYSTPSMQLPRNYSNQSANTNARLNCLLQYILCASRFAHYMKLMMRDKIGSFIGQEDCQRFLQRWLLSYCANSSESSGALAKYPLRESKVIVSEIPSNPGKYTCLLYIKPHYQLEHLDTSLKLVSSFNIR